MKRFIIYIFIIAGAGMVGWHYAPPEMRQRLAAFIASALSGPESTINQYIKDEILPKNPQEKREALIQALRKNMDTIKQSVTSPVSIPARTKSRGNLPYIKDNAATIRIVAESDALIKQLEDANKDVSFTETVTNRVLERVSSSNQNTKNCSTTGQ